MGQSPFVRALRNADNFLVVRNSTTDLYSRIWCICEIMYARKYDFIPKKTLITGPDGFKTACVSCLDAGAYDPNDRDKIIKVLLEKKGARAEIDQYIKEFRAFNSCGIVEVGVKSVKKKNKALEDFLGKSWYSAMRTELDDFGVESVE